jgi:ribose transport system substrate-binding protein
MRRGTTTALLVALGVLALAACGSSKKSSTSSSAGASTGSSSSSSGKKSYKMTLVAGVKGDEFYITMNCGAQAEAKKLGVSLNFQGPDQFDAGQQTPIVNAVGAAKPDAMLVAPTDSKAMYAPIRQVDQAGTKVVLVDTTLDQSGFAVSQIASDNEAAGRAAADALAKLIGGKGKVFVVNVKPGISTTDLRGKGFQEEAKKIGLTYLGQDFDNDQPDQAAAIVKAQLAKHKDLKGVFATNLFSAEGSATGAREAGSKIKIVGFDAGPKQVQDLKQGIVQALIAQQPAKIGATGVDQAYAALTGKSITKKIPTGTTTITKDNLAQQQAALYKAGC